MNALVIGGSRNLGPQIVDALLHESYGVAVMNRAVTPSDLPANVERLRADRSNPAEFRSALGKREFDLVVDTTLYNGADAQSTVDILKNRVGRYIFLSTGQVYLVIAGAKRPFCEDDYAGKRTPRPADSEASDLKNWLYGIEKRDAEEVLFASGEKDNFSFTTLRLPMINSERDHYDRIYGYLLRLWDGGPIVLPEDNLALRHVYSADVVSAILRAANDPRAAKQVFNISQEETVTIDDFLAQLAEMAGRLLRTVRISRSALDEHSLLPACSPFSDAWMSELDNTRSKRELGLAYTPLRTYLGRLVDHYSQQPRRDVAGYARRNLELSLANAAAKK